MPAVPTAEERPTMSLAETAEALGICMTTAYVLVERGEIPAIRVGHKFRVPTAAFRRMLSLDDEVPAS